ncbi:hypothetical protein Tco_0249302, partial [Tanacetum coccineum]
MHSGQRYEGIRSIEVGSNKRYPTSWDNKWYLVLYLIDLLRKPPGSGKQKSPQKSPEKSPEKMKSAEKMEED